MYEGNNIMGENSSGPSASMIRAMQEMEEFERKHAVGVNRGKFFAADPPDSQIVRDAVTPADPNFDEFLVLSPSA